MIPRIELPMTVEDALCVISYCEFKRKTFALDGPHEAALVEAYRIVKEKADFVLNRAYPAYREALAEEARRVEATR